MILTFVGVIPTLLHILPLRLIPIRLRLLPDSIPILVTLPRAMVEPPSHHRHRDFTISPPVLRLILAVKCLLILHSHRLPNNNSNITKMPIARIDLATFATPSERNSSWF